jgi:DNA-directed RNA polymerase subunit RPC12/RpoP
MSHKSENAPFVCANCGREILPSTDGSYRNHCPYCLCSLHVDEFPGDRAATCGGIMDAVGAEFNPKKGWQIIHVCRICGYTSKNKLTETGVQPDNMEIIFKLMRGK